MAINVDDVDDHQSSENSEAQYGDTIPEPSQKRAKRPKKSKGQQQPVHQVEDQKFNIIVLQEDHPGQLDDSQPKLIPSPGKRKNKKMY